MGVDTGSVEAKRSMRRSMRRLRLELDDRPRRSEVVVAHLVALDAMIAARRVLAYDAVPGEVDTSALARWCGGRGVEVAVPEDEVDPSWADVFVVPGIAFTDRGARLGQGGGWYDRFLPARRPGATTIGIGFDVQLVDDLPVEPHDVVLDAIVVESGVRRRP
ncbi:5-formyltetrahydrofolate cyclo-ligase [Ilumatobacter sp.]|uniref:5-formyltetrahydrofolate cyclo-ligase n=1 Tax=Ilumatobacter sp. TaxID=1967498 RepID=UPI003B52ECFF